MSERVQCSVCRVGHIFIFGCLFVCAYCQKAWQEWEILRDLRDAEKAREEVQS